MAKPQMMLLAKLLTKAQNISLPYPGGPLIDKYAQLGNPKPFFTKPKVPGLNFSRFKTAILYFIQKKK
jgi:N6-L-threonylcarbamoyladenine synthase